MKQTILIGHTAAVFSAMDRIGDAFAEFGDAADMAANPMRELSFDLPDMRFDFSDIMLDEGHHDPIHRGMAKFKFENACVTKHRR
jgi:hypothetical protein